MLPEFYLLKGDLLLALPDAKTDDADALFQQAFDVAQNLDARMPQLRAAVRLCRLRQGHPGENESRTTLRNIYDTFTEGFATADLTDAAALLTTA